MAIKIRSARKHGFFHIVASGLDGQQYTLKRRFAENDPKKIETLHKIRAKGEINLEHWSKGEHKF